MHRFKYKEGKTQAQIHKEVREGSSGPQKPLTGESKKKIEATQKEIAGHYKDYKNSLPETEVQLKNELDKLVQSQDKEKGRGR